MSSHRSLLERVAAGDGTAVRECIDHYRNLVWSLARRYAESAADAEDAVQEIYVEVWKSAARFDSAVGSESLFITTIARRRLIDRLRARKRRPAMEELEEAHLVDTGPLDELSTPFSSEVDAAKRALDTLDPKVKETLLLGIVEGLTHAEIATRTGRPLGTVKTQIRRGMSRLRARLGEAGNDSVEARRTEERRDH